MSKFVLFFAAAYLFLATNSYAYFCSRSVNITGTVSEAIGNLDEYYVCVINELSSNETDRHNRLADAITRLSDTVGALSNRLEYIENENRDLRERIEYLESR